MCGDVGRWAQPSQCGAVLGRGVAGVALPAIAGKALGQRLHLPVPRDLGDDGCGRDREAEPSPSITIGWGRRSPAAVAVDDASSGVRPSAATARCMASSAAWRMLSCSISATVASPTPTWHAPEAARRLFALLGRQLLGIVDAGGQPPGQLTTEHDGGGDHRSRQRRAPGLVDADDGAFDAPLELPTRHRRSVAPLFESVRGPGLGSTALVPLLRHPR